MAGGAYTALSGLRTRQEQLDRVAADLANVNTAGYKSERVTTIAAERADFSRALQSAVDVTPGPGRLDMRSGMITPTGRELDFALEGGGFFTVETPQGVRYTRNGQFDRRADGTLVTRWITVSPSSVGSDCGGGGSSASGPAGSSAATLSSGRR